MSWRDEKDLAAVGPCGPDQAGELRRVAAGFVRKWVSAASDHDALTAIDAIGADAVRGAADLSRRFGCDDELSRKAERTLQELRLLVEAVHVGPARARLRLLAPRTLPPLETRLKEAEPRLSALLNELSEHHDLLAREEIRMRGLIEQLRQADQALEHAVHLSHALQKAFDAAARELDRDDPARAARFQDTLSLRLTERLRDLLTQLVVVRQGRLAIEVIVKGQSALVRALGRTRDTMVAALRTAVTARRSAGQGQRISGETESGDEEETELARAVAAMRSGLFPGVNG